MDFLDIFFNIVFGVFLLLGIGSIFFGILMVFKPSLISRQPPVLHDSGFRVSGIFFVIVGVEFTMKNARYLFDVDWPDTHYLISASAFLLFFVVIGILTVLGRPFLATNLIPKITSKRLLLGSSFIVFGFLCFFKLSEDYWPVPETIQDLIFWAMFFLLFFSPVLLSRLRKQANYLCHFYLFATLR